MKIITGLVVLMLAGDAAGQSAKTKNGSIEGRVISAATGEGVSGTRLTLSVVAAPGSPDYLKIPRSFASVTNAEGVFVFDGLTPNTYFLGAEVEGYVFQDYGPFELSSERGVGDIVLRMRHASVVTGHILSGVGPLEGIEVILLKPGYDETGQKTFRSLRSVRTDDRGEYRLFGIEPGAYHLMARAPSTPSMTSRTTLFVPGAPPSQDLLLKYGVVYYPGTVDFSHAAQIDLKPGVELKGLNLVMTEQPTYRVRGSVVDGATGNPGSASIGIFPRNGVGITGSAFPAGSPNGTFELQSISPGEYVLLGILGLRSVAPGSPDPPARIVRANVDVVASNVENVVLTFPPLVRISGRLSVEGQANLAGMESFQARLVTVKGGAAIPVPARPVRTHSVPGADGTFLYDGVIPGEYELRFGGLPANAYVKEAKYGDGDVLTNPMKISSDKESLKIVVSPNGGQVEGTLFDDNKRPAGSAEISLIPDDRNRLGLYRRILTDGAGHFSIHGLAPGGYKLFAWDRAPTNAHFDADFVRTYEDKGTYVEISGSSRLTLDLQRIIASPQFPIER